MTRTYANIDWADLLTSYDGNTIEYDNIGNPTSVKDSSGNVLKSYTWTEGRQLASYTVDGVTWTYTYDADGMRTGRTNGTDTYQYFYNGDQLVRMVRNNEVIDFTYAGGQPATMTYNGTTYYYLLNAQGDVVGLTNSEGTIVLGYTYGAYGTITGLMPDTTLAPALLDINPLTYRGYVYDRDTKLFYLQSRYYDPIMGRFINSDSYASTGQGILGNNMFAYCNNNPVIRCDPTGEALDTVWDIISFGKSLTDVFTNPANLAAWFSLAADAACLIIPGLTGGGGIVRFVTNADNISDAVKYVDNVVDTAKAISSSLETGNKMHKLYMKFKDSSTFFTNKTIGKIFDEVISRLRPDAVDTANKIIYELKPYNRDSFLRAIEQVSNYLDTISEEIDDWVVVIDMYFD